MFSLLTQFGDSSSGLGALGLNASSFLIQLVTFIIALLILRKWAFKPILKIMNERRDLIEKGVRLGQEMEKEKAELEAKADQKLHEARVKADSIIAAANDTARQSVREAEAKAKAKADGIIASADEAIVQRTAQAKRDLENEMVSLVAGATEAVVREKVDAKKDVDLIKRALKEQKA
jgi:F-type H+-transporting ATPase subunit b